MTSLFEFVVCLVSREHMAVQDEVIGGAGLKHHCSLLDERGGQQRG